MTEEQSYQDGHMRTGDANGYQTIAVSQHTCAECRQQAVTLLAMTGQGGRYLCLKHGNPQAWEAGYNAGYACGYSAATFDLARAAARAERRG